MTAVVWAAPVAETPPPPLFDPEYTHLWHGVDGSTWDMNDWTSGVYMQSGIKGMGFVGVDRWTSTSPALAGSRFRGSRAQQRMVQWPIVICTDQGVDWKTLCRRWWRSWSPDVAGTWEVIDSNGRSLSIDLRHNPSDDFTLDIDPALDPWQPFMVDAIADDPWWRGQPITGGPWGAGGTPKHLFDTTSGLLPLHFVPEANFSNAQITNPGDVDASLMFTAAGQLTAFTINIGDGVIAGPAVAAGHTVTVDTTPQGQIAMLDGTTDITYQFTQWDPRPVLAGQTLPLSIITSGAGSIAAQLVPLYRMAL